MSTYEISKSSLLSLKVEILRKQEEINKSKLENKSFVPASSTHNRKGPKVAKNKGVEERSENDYEEDPDLLRKSRQMLEAKSKLYDKLSNKQSDFEENKHYLVNFNQKSDKNARFNDTCPNFDDDPDDIDRYPEAAIAEQSPKTTEVYNDDDIDSEDEWTEYTDALGRTRTCLKKDLEYMKNKDQRIIGETKAEQELEENKAEEKKIKEFNERSELLSSDMKRELLRQQWEKEEAALAQKDNVHYQNVLFDEARTHGVGYFAFSKDETERAKQQAELEKLRRETTQKQKHAQDLKKGRENILKNRIRAAQNRKRARLGLPPIGSDEESEKPDDKEVEKPVAKTELSQDEIEREMKRQQHVRPWDIGKEGVQAPKEHYIYSQEEWIMKKREERIHEFAPPKSDRRNSKKSNTRPTKKLRENPRDGATINPYKTTTNDLSYSDSSSSSDEDRLMQSYKENQPKQDTSTNKISFKISQSITPTSSSNAPNSSFIPTTESTRISSNAPKSSSNTQNTQNTFTPKPIINELLYSPTQSSDDSSSDNDKDMSSSNKEKYAAIPPPSTFDNYGPTGGARSAGRGGKRGGNMEDSIMMGLKYLREQAEGKGKLNRGDDDLMQG